MHQLYRCIMDPGTMENLRHHHDATAANHILDVNVHQKIIISSMTLEIQLFFEFVRGSYLPFLSCAVLWFPILHR